MSDDSKKIGRNLSKDEPQKQIPLRRSPRINNNPSSDSNETSTRTPKGKRLSFTENSNLKHTNNTQESSSDQEALMEKISGNCETNIGDEDTSLKRKTRKTSNNQNDPVKRDIEQSIPRRITRSQTNSFKTDKSYTEEENTPKLDPIDEETHMSDNLTDTQQEDDSLINEQLEERNTENESQETRSDCKLSNSLNDSSAISSSNTTLSSEENTLEQSLINKENGLEISQLDDNDKTDTSAPVSALNTNGKLIEDENNREESKLTELPDTEKIKSKENGLETSKLDDSKHSDYNDKTFTSAPVSSLNTNGKVIEDENNSEEAKLTELPDSEKIEDKENGLETSELDDSKHSDYNDKTFTSAPVSSLNTNGKVIEEESKLTELSDPDKIKDKEKQIDRTETINQKYSQLIDSSDIDYKIDELLSVTCTSDDESEDNRNEFLDSMAEEGEEDTPSEGSNDIIEVGEEINTTESELSTDESYESNSFIDDEEECRLLSGDEFDLSLEEPKKKSRIIQLDCESDDDIIKIERPKKERKKKPRKSRIIRMPDSSDEDVEIDVTTVENEESSTHSLDNKRETVNGDIENDQVASNKEEITNDSAMDMEHIDMNRTEAETLTPDKKEKTANEDTDKDFEVSSNKKEITNDSAIDSKDTNKDGTETLTQKSNTTLSSEENSLDQSLINKENGLETPQLDDSKHFHYNGITFTSAPVSNFKANVKVIEDENNREQDRDAIKDKEKQVSRTRMLEKRLEVANKMAEITNDSVTDSKDNKDGTETLTQGSSTPIKAHEMCETDTVRKIGNIGTDNEQSKSNEISTSPGPVFVNITMQIVGQKSNIIKNVTIEDTGKLPLNEHVKDIVDSLSSSIDDASEISIKLSARYLDLESNEKHSNGINENVNDVLTNDESKNNSTDNLIKKNKMNFEEEALRDYFKTMSNPSKQDLKHHQQSNEVARKKGTKRKHGDLANNNEDSSEEAFVVKKKNKKRQHRKSSGNGVQMGILDEVLASNKNDISFTSYDWDMEDIAAKRVNFNKSQTKSKECKLEKNGNSALKKFSSKDFKNSMLFDSSRVNRVMTKQVLKKKGIQLHHF